MLKLVKYKSKGTCSFCGKSHKNETMYSEYKDIDYDQLLYKLISKGYRGRELNRKIRQAEKRIDKHEITTDIRYAIEYADEPRLDTKLGTNTDTIIREHSKIKTFKQFPICKKCLVELIDSITYTL